MLPTAQMVTIMYIHNPFGINHLKLFVGHILCVCMCVGEWTCVLFFETGHFSSTFYELLLHGRGCVCVGGLVLSLLSCFSFFMYCVCVNETGIL